MKNNYRQNTVEVAKNTAANEVWITGNWPVWTDSYGYLHFLKSRILQEKNVVFGNGLRWYRHKHGTRTREIILDQTTIQQYFHQLKTCR